MSQEELEIVLRPDGEIEVATHGVKGKRCIEYVKALVAALGKVRHSEKTAEFFEEEVVSSTETHVQQDIRRK